MLRCIRGDFNLMPWVTTDAVLRFCKGDGRTTFHTGIPKIVHTLAEADTDMFNLFGVKTSLFAIILSLYTRAPWGLKLFTLYQPRTMCMNTNVQCDVYPRRTPKRPIVLANMNPPAVFSPPYVTGTRVKFCYEHVCPFAYPGFVHPRHPSSGMRHVPLVRTQWDHLHIIPVLLSLSDNVHAAFKRLKFKKT